VAECQVIIDDFTTSQSLTSTIDAPVSDALGIMVGGVSVTRTLGLDRTDGSLAVNLDVFGPDFGVPYQLSWANDVGTKSIGTITYDYGTAIDLTAGQTDVEFQLSPLVVFEHEFALGIHVTTMTLTAGTGAVFTATERDRRVDEFQETGLEVRGVVDGDSVCFGEITLRFSLQSVEHRTLRAFKEVAVPKNMGSPSMILIFRGR
jgi:hypothetical protein